MKKFLRLSLFSVVTICAIVTAQASLGVAALEMFFGSALLSGHVPGFAFTITLTTAEIVADLFDAFRKMIPALNYFATDFSSASAKFNQQIIAHVAGLPVAVNHDTTNGFFQTPSNARNLITDVPLTIDTWKDVILKFQANDLVADRTQKYIKTVNGAAYVLGKAMIDSVIAKVDSSNISNAIVCAAANATYAKLRTFAVQLNTQGAGPTRFGLCGSNFMSGLLADTIIASGDYFDQRQEGNPFMILNNIAGFQGIQEYPDFQPDYGAVTVVAATDLFTLANHGFVAGDTVRFRSDTTLPAGVTANTTYFVIASGLTTNAFKVSATLGGATIDVTDTGTGIHTVYAFNLNGFFFEDRAVVVASRLPADSIELARARGVPVPLNVQTQTDPESGLSVLALERLNTSTLDLELCFSVMFGSAIGKQAGSAGAMMDNAGLRVTEA